MRALGYFILAVCMVVLLMPLYIMVIGSFMELKGFMARPPSLVLRDATLYNYQTLYADGELGRWFMNTIYITVATVTLTLVTVVTAGYCFSRFPSRAVTVVYCAFIIAIIVPRSVLIIPLYTMMKTIGLSGTRVAVVLPSVFFPVGILIYKKYLDEISTEYDESAMCDGAKTTTIITQVLMPMTQPALAAVATFAAMGVIADFLWPFLVLQRPALRTLTVGLMHKIYQPSGAAFFMNPIGMRMAAGVILFLPLLIIYAVLHRYFLEGVTTGGLKG